MLRLARRPLLAALALPVLAACGDDGDGPPAPVAVLPVTAAQLEALAAPLAPTVESPTLNAVLGSVRVALGLPFIPNEPPEAVRGDRAVVAPPAAPAAQLASPFWIPDSLLGRTFLPDTQLLGDRWRVDTLPDGTPRPGAPPDGVRFALLWYDLSSGSFQRVRAGSLDMLQSGSPTAPQFVAEVRDTTGRRLMRWAAGGSFAPGIGYTEVGGLRIDQAAARSGSGRRTEYRVSGPVALIVTREVATSRSGTEYLHTMTVGEHRLQVHARMQLSSGMSVVTTYTVLVDGAPFATVQESLGADREWRHVRDDRPLTAAERAQVRAFVLVLQRLPDAEVVFTRGLFDIMSLTASGTFP